MADLGLGKRIDPLELTPENVGKAIDEVLSSEEYLSKVVEFSKKSRQYNGIKNGAAMIIEHMQTHC